MSKEISTILKGIAILMMLWYHLFGISELEELCTPLIYIYDKALVAYIARASYPVSFFLILSGYGLTYIYKQRHLEIKNQIKRITKLYINYWIVLVIFVPIGYFIKPDVYPNDFIHIAANLTGLHCTWNGETWFLLPYAIISLSSYWIIDFVYSLNNKVKIIITLAVYAIVFLLARHLGNHLPENVYWATLLILPVYLVQFIFYFSLGILLYRLVESKNKQLNDIKPQIYLITIIILIIIKSLIKITIADGIYAFIFIWCIIHLSIPEFFKKILYKLGQRSMIMWMTHTFFSVYLFSDFIYGFKYPILIFIALIVVTYLTAIPIMWLTNKVIRIIPL
jgi:hypothetical protein